MDKIGTITLIIAIWGALLATINSLMAYFKFRKKLDFYIYIVSESQMNKDGLVSQEQSKRTIYYLIKNVGARKVYFGKPGFIIPNAIQYIYFDFETDVKFPFTLRSGKSLLVWHSYDLLLNELQKLGYQDTVTLRAFISDPIGKNYTSNKLKISLPNTPQ